jgi:hypothetical protein
MADYGGEIQGFMIMLELAREAFDEVLAPTPFEFVAPYAWLEVLLYKTISGIAPFEVPADAPYRNSGFYVPARFGDTVGVRTAPTTTRTRTTGWLRVAKGLGSRSSSPTSSTSTPRAPSRRRSRARPLATRRR